MLLNGEAHIVDLARELQGDAEKRGMQILAASLAAEWVSVYFGGQYPSTRNSKRRCPGTIGGCGRHEHGHQPSRSAGASLSQQGRADVREWAGPLLEGYNPAWAQRFDQLYGYNPTRAKGTLEGSRLSAWHPARQDLVVCPTCQAGDPPLAEAVATYLQAVGIQATIENIDPVLLEPE